MPKVDMDMTSGKIMAWHVAPGGHVGRGEPLFDIETDKAAMEVEAPESGFLHHPVDEGTEVPIGKPVAWLYAEGEEVGQAPPAMGREVAERPKEIAREDVPVPRVPEEPAAPVSAVPDKTRATPLARSLAREAGVALETLAGTGLKGRVQADDVRSALRASVPARPNFVAETGPLAVSRSKGGTGEPLVLIHGFLNDSKSWALIEGHIGHRPLIRIDLPGHGRSPRLRIGSFQELVSVVRRTFDELQIESAGLVGHSLGGAVALAIADTRPRSVSSLTLIAPAGLGPEINAGTVTGICRATAAESLAPWLRTLVADERLITDSYARAVMASRSDPGLRAAQSALAEVVFRDGVQVMDLRAALERVEMPTRILWGKRDRVIPWQHALAAPGKVALHLQADAGHIPQFEIAQEVGTLLASFL